MEEVSTKHIVGENRYSVGAAILPITTDPEFGGVYFLLGKECKRMSWMNCSDCWSPFGGSKLRRDKSSSATAAREWVEESESCARLFSDTKQHSLKEETAEYVQSRLDSKDYYLKLTSFYFDKRRQQHVTYTIFVVIAPWDPACCSRFNLTKRCEAEKSALRLWSIPQLQNAVKREGVLCCGENGVERCTPVFTQFLKHNLSAIVWGLPSV